MLEGENTDANLLRLQTEVSQAIDKEKDSITFYMLLTTKYLRKTNLGVVKSSPDMFL